MPNRLAASRWLRPSTRQASRTRRYRSTVYILPPSISKKIEGYRWQSFTPPAAGKSRRFRGLICHRRSQLRFHRGLKHPSGGFWPCMVALVTRGADNAPLAIHRTFLARDGGGKAPIDPAKMMLGPCRGGGDPSQPAR